MAKAIHLNKFAGEQFLEGDNLTLENVPIPEPGEGEVLVQVYLRPINPTDLLLMKGGWGTHHALPRVPGTDGVARVVRSGPGAGKFKEGARVVGAPWPTFTPAGGSWATHVAVPEKNLYAVPESLSDETASQFWVNPITVYGMLLDVAVPKGGWLLQTAASSVLGRMVIQLAQHYGIKTINVVRRKEAVQELRDLGADEVISTDSEDIEERVTAITGGKGAYAALDAVGGPQTAKVVAALRAGGHYLVYGFLDTRKAEYPVTELLAKGKVLRGFLLSTWLAQQDKQQVVDEVFRLLADKVIVPFSGKHYPLAQFKEAITASLEAGRGAKLFLEG